MRKYNHPGFPLTALALALLAAYAPALAQDSEEVKELITPESSASVGVGSLSQDAPRFGQYSGVRKEGSYGLLDLDVVKRNDDSGTWLRFTGRSLGLDSAELRMSHERQGDWGYFLDYNQIPRYEPYTITTAVTGIGTANLVVPATSTPGVPVQLKTQRDALTLGFNKHVSRDLSFEVTLKNEEKNGARLWGRGTTGGAGVFEFFPESIHSRTRQLEATVSYSREKLNMAAAYYGSFYNNLNNSEYGQYSPTGGSASIANPLGLPPDNQSHQLSLAGSYRFGASTNATFKLARATATQEDTFMTNVGTLAPAVVAAGTNNLGAKVETTLMQAGLTMRPLPKLSLLANLRYEDRDDKTPVLRYATTANATATYDGDNEPRSIRRTSGKFEGTYQLPVGLRLTGGVDYEEKKRNTSAVRSVSYREKTQETSYRVALARTMSETVTGTVAYIRSSRTGSDFQTTVLNNVPATPGINLIAPVHLADRERDKMRLAINWMPTEKLSLQFMADAMRDDYKQRTAHELGLREGKASNYSVDASYAFTDDWQATAWTSLSSNNTQQASAPSVAATANASTVISNIWGSNVSSDTSALGLGMRGKLNARLSIGADLSHSNILDQYQQYAIGTITVASLPSVTTKLNRIKLNGHYALNKNSGVRVDFIHDSYETDDWTWTNFTYSDGTTVTQNPNQVINFVGVSYIYKF